MTYEELRQRCLNHAQMHPSNPSDLETVVNASRRCGTVGDVAQEIARYVEARRAKHRKVKS